jgi:hypothetical protein
MALKIDLHACSDTPGLAFKSAFSRARVALLTILDFAAGYGVRGAWILNSTPAE